MPKLSSVPIAAVAAVFVVGLALTPNLARCMEDRVAVPPPASASLPWTSPVLLAEDVDVAADWYRRHLGFDPAGERVDGASRIVLLSHGATVVSLRPLAVDVTGSVAAAPATVKVRAPLTLFVDDVDAAVAELRDAGAIIVAVPQDDAAGRDRIARLIDPFGNRLVLKEPLPRGS